MHACKCNMNNISVHNVTFVTVSIHLYFECRRMACLVEDEVYTVRFDRRIINQTKSNGQKLSSQLYSLHRIITAAVR